MPFTAPSHPTTLRLLAGVAACLLATAAGASSTASSAISQSTDSISASANSISGSVHDSSNSSKTAATAQGDYTVVQVAAADTKPGWITVALKPHGSDDGRMDIALLIPGTAMPTQGLKTGDMVHAQAYEYGIEFSTAQDQKPFFLAIKDEKVDSLRSVAVTL